MTYTVNGHQGETMGSSASFSLVSGVAMLMIKFFLS